MPTGGKKQAKSCKAKKKKSPENEQRKAKLPPASPGTDDMNSSTDEEQLSAAQSSAQSCSDTMEGVQDYNGRGARPDNTTVKLDDSQTMQLKEQIKEVICAEPVLAKLVDQITAAVLDQVTQNVYAAINLDLEKNKKDLEKSQKQVNELEKKVKQMEKKLMDCENSQEEQEQYSRRNCLRIYGMPEKKDENSDDVVLQLVNSKLNLGFQVRESDLDRTHRIQPRKPRTEGAEQPRPLIVKFARYNVRQKVYAARMKLKNTRIYIREDLTRSRQELIRETLKCESISKAWTNDGRIRALTKENKIVNIRHCGDLQKL